jgi:urease accessory protein UreF
LGALCFFRIETSISKDFMHTTKPGSDLDHRSFQLVFLFLVWAFISAFLVLELSKTLLLRLTAVFRSHCALFCKQLADCRRWAHKLSGTLPFATESMNNTRGNTAEWRELLKLLKQAALAQAEPEEAVLQRLEAASRDLLQGFTPAAAVAVAAISSLNDRQEILELLLSTVKAVEAGGFRDIDYGGNQQGDAWCLAAAMTAAAMLADPPKDANSDRPAALEQQQLGWLVLFGRCCSYLHKHLQKTETTGMMLGPGGMLPPQLGKPGVDWCVR